MEFSELPIPAELLEGIRGAGFATCTPIQSLTLPLTLNGKDVAGQAQTGTGKTAAFLIATFSRLTASSATPGVASDALEVRGGDDHDPLSQTPVSHPRALIIAPTRELVVQIERDARLIGRHTAHRIAAVYGGVDYEKQKQLLTDGGIDLLIGTPGRLIDYYKQKFFRVNRVEVLVIDEADRMFDMGFITDLRYLLRRLPSFEHRLSMLFSATLSYRAQELSYEFMNSPEILTTEQDLRTVQQVVQALYHVEGRRKISFMVGLIKRDMQETVDGGVGRVMIFVNTKRMGEKLRKWLRANDIQAGYLSGDVPQSIRLKVLQRFGDGQLPVLIATDVAGRGLHIDGVTHVINFDLPENPEDYIHRIGRTARAGARGDAISLVDEDGVYNLEAIERCVGARIQVQEDDPALYVSLQRPSVEPRGDDEGEVRLTPRPKTSGRGRGRGSRAGAGTAAGRRTMNKSGGEEVVVSAPESHSGGGEGVVEKDPAKKKRRKRRRKKAVSGGGGGEAPGLAQREAPAVAEIPGD
ncbi:MAG: DEAD/DEAH box helicase [Magnetococcales bacterium]|nr:DEAD/DEAH box helicase [Magnetococcales bacterium]MBF0631763.1 DEAD/DEAH box helicase [Magnetococcales bacterium]